MLHVLSRCQKLSVGYLHAFPGRDERLLKPVRASLGSWGRWGLDPFRDPGYCEGSDVSWGRGGGPEGPGSRWVVKWSTLWFSRSLGGFNVGDPFRSELSPCRNCPAVDVCSQVGVVVG